MSTTAQTLQTLEAQLVKADADIAEFRAGNAHLRPERYSEVYDRLVSNRCDIARQIQRIKNIEMFTSRGIPLTAEILEYL